MSETKSTYHKTTIQLVLLYVVLLLNVFAFTGYNEEIRCSLLESPETELLESKKHVSCFNLNNQSQRIIKIDPIESSMIFRAHNYSWVLSSFNNCETAKFKSSCKEVLSFDFTSKKLPNKSLQPSPEDENADLAIG